MPEMFDPLVVIYMQLALLKMRPTRYWLTRYVLLPALSSLLLKQSVMPDISLMTVFWHTFSTRPTRSNLGMSELNYYGCQ